MKFALNPLTAKKLRRFRQIRRGYVSFVILMVMIGLSLIAELLVSNRALVVRYEGKTYLPTYGGIIPGRSFGLGYDYETDYRELRDRFLDLFKRV